MKKIINSDAPDLLTPGEVAQMFRVDIKSLTRWDKAGWFPPGTVIRTLGGHRRFKTAVIEAMLNGQGGGGR